MEGERRRGGGVVALLYGVIVAASAGAWERAGAQDYPRCDADREQLASKIEACERYLCTERDALTGQPLLRVVKGRGARGESGRCLIGEQMPGRQQRVCLLDDRARRSLVALERARARREQATDSEVMAYYEAWLDPRECAYYPIR